MYTFRIDSSQEEKTGIAGLSEEFIFLTLTFLIKIHSKHFFTYK